MVLSYEDCAPIIVVKNNSRKWAKKIFLQGSTARVVTSKKEGCSESQTPVKIRCSKPVTHTAESYFIKLGIYLGRGEKRASKENVDG